MAGSKFKEVAGKIEIGSSGHKKAHNNVSDKVLEIYLENNTENASTSYEPFLLNTTLTGAGQVGGRARFYMTTNVALGGWANALKAEVLLQSAGKVSGLCSAFCAELTMPGSTLTTGNYAPLEIELNCPTSFVTGAGTPTAFIYASAQGAAVAAFRDNGYVMKLAGVGAAASGKIFQANTADAATHALKIRIDNTDYYIMLTDTGA